MQSHVITYWPYCRRCIGFASRRDVAYGCAAADGAHVKRDCPTAYGYRCPGLRAGLVSHQPRTQRERRPRHRRPPFVTPPATAGVAHRLAYGGGDPLTAARFAAGGVTMKLRVALE